MPNRVFTRRLLPSHVSSVHPFQCNTNPQDYHIVCLSSERQHGRRSGPTWNRSVFLLRRWNKASMRGRRPTGTPVSAMPPPKSRSSGTARQRVPTDKADAASMGKQKPQNGPAFHQHGTQGSDKRNYSKAQGGGGKRSRVGHDARASTTTRKTTRVTTPSLQSALPSCLHIRFPQFKELLKSGGK